MTWFLVALGAPLLYTSANYIDKYVLSRFVQDEGGVGGIVIFSSLFAVVMVPISYLIDPLTLGMPLIFKLILVLNGIVSMTSLVIYLNALQKYDTSSVVPLYQLIPVFSYILGYLILGEVLNLTQIIACALIVVGAFVLSLSLEGGRMKLNFKLLKLMGAASFFSALTGVIFKKVALDAGYWQSQFWEYCGIFLLGLILLAFVRTYRNDFIQLYRATRGRIFGYSSATEAAMIGGDLLFNFSILLVPVTLVYVVNSFQPLFVLIFGIVLSKLLPKHYSEIHSRKGLIQKTLAIVIMVGGAVVLAVYG
jgi:drug/metabolite transporter (DMT)-like permease